MHQSLCFLSIIALSLYCHHSSAQARPASLHNSIDTVRFGDHTVVLSRNNIDTLVTAAGRMLVSMPDPVPKSVDGDSIYQYLPQGPVAKDGPDWQDALFLWLRQDLARLVDGQYSLRVPNIVVDRNGQVAYYDRPGLTKTGATKGVHLPVDSTFCSELSTQVTAFLGDYAFLPALNEGRPAATVIHFYRTLFVKDHQAVLKQQ